MRILRVMLIILLILILLTVGGCTALGMYMDYRNENYYKFANPGGDIEAKYTAMGNYEVSYSEFNAKNELYEKYEIWYPTQLKDSDNRYPLVIMANGTGIKASMYKEVFRHLASWGFIVAGNEDENSRTGASSAETLDFLLSENENPSSIFYAKVDTENIGITGHSQGGVGAINAVTNQSNGNIYKAIWAASTTSLFFARAEVLGADWSYDLSKVTIPCFMVSGIGTLDAGTAKNINTPNGEGQGICPLWSLTESYNRIPSNTPKGIARIKNYDHGDTLRYTDGYMTAWFMYHLKGDSYAGSAFLGNSAEIRSNVNWQDVIINK